MTGTGHVQFRFSLRLAAILLLGAISACGSSTENRRAMKSSGDAKQAATIKSTLIFAAPRAERTSLSNLSYTISCPPKANGKRGQSFQISASTTNLRDVFRNATEDYDHCVADLTSLHFEMTETLSRDRISSGKIDWTCDLNPSRGLRSISNPNVPSNVMLGKGPSIPSAIVAAQTCVPKSLGLTAEPETRAIVLTQPFPTDPLSKLQSEESLIVGFEEATIPAPTVTTTSTTGSIATSPVIPIDTFPVEVTNLSENQGITSNEEPVSPEFKCVDLNVDSSKLPPSVIDIQTKNPWCTAVALRHAYAAVINCSSLNKSSATNISTDTLLDSENLLKLKFRHIADSNTGTVSWVGDPPENAYNKFSADLPFSGNFAGRTCVVLALPTSAPNDTTELAPNPFNGKYSFIYSPFHAELPDPSTCLAGIPTLTGTASQYLSQIDFDSATTLGVLVPDNDDSTTSTLAFSTKILKDIIPSNSAKTYTRDAAIVGSYDTSCSRRALRFAKPPEPNTLTNPATNTTVTTASFGLAVELSGDAKAAMLNAFKDELAPSTLKGLSLGFMHKPTLKTLTAGTKLPIFGFGHLAINDADKPKERLNGLYWQQKDYIGTKRWAVCLKLHGRDDLCVSETLANDNNIAAVTTEKTFVALTMSRYPKEQDASRTVYISLYVNGKIGFFDGSGSKTAIEVSDAEARNFMNGISHFVVGANLE